jgi:hypothetical protein
LRAGLIDATATPLRIEEDAGETANRIGLALEKKVVAFSQKPLGDELERNTEMRGETFEVCPGHGHILISFTAEAHAVLA